MPNSGAAEDAEHPSDKFVRAFMAGQTLTGLRSRYGPNWQLAEFWKEKVRPHREVVDQFVDPIIEEALRKRGSGGDEKVMVGQDEGVKAQTLLDHLVSHTQGLSSCRELIISCLSIVFRSSDLKRRSKIALFHFKFASADI